MREIALRCGFWEGYRGSKWLLPSADLWPVAVYLAGHGVWLEGARPISPLPGQRVFLHELKARHFIVRDDGAISERLIAALDRLPGKLRVDVTRCGPIDW